jgi:hypothetical protein
VDSTCLPNKKLSVIEKRTENKYEYFYQSSFNTLKVDDNGTVWLIVKSVEEAYNVRRFVPYHSEIDVVHRGEYNTWTSQKSMKH